MILINYLVGLLKRHTVCRRCIKNITICPIDKKKLIKDWFDRDLIALNLIEEVHIKC